TCYPFEWWTIAAGQENSAREEIRELVPVTHAMVKVLDTGILDGIPRPRIGSDGPWKTNVLLGLNGYEWDGKREVPMNTALLVDREGNPQGRYDKMHLVPFGEYVPFRETFPWLQSFTPYTHDYSCRPGETFT